eukprot:9503822-Pyramimonas_sp.AAC.2
MFQCTRVVRFAQHKVHVPSTVAFTVTAGVLGFKFCLCKSKYKSRPLQQIKSIGNQTKEQEGRAEGYHEANGCHDWVLL